MLDAVLTNPVECRRRPPLRLPVAAGVDEVHELFVGHVVDVDLEGRYVGDEAGELVVPAKGNLAGACAKRGAARGNRDPCAWRARAARVSACSRRGPLLFVRQLVPHVEHRFLVHRLVLEDGEHRLGVVQQRMPGLIERRIRERVEDERIAVLGEPPDLLSSRPAGALTAARRRLVFRIDAAREQPLETFVNARTTEPLLHERVDAEGRKVSLIEHDRMTERNGTRVVGLRPDDVE